MASNESLILIDAFRDIDRQSLVIVVRSRTDLILPKINLGID